MNDLSTTTDIAALMREMGARAKAAATELAFADPAAKRLALEKAAEAIWDFRDEIVQENGRDLELGRDKGLSDAMMDRLLLDEPRLKGLCDGLRAVAALPDPVGAVLAEWEQPSGIAIKRVRTPLGVVGVIYESRPNVTADAGALCLMAGNAVILRGGSESFHSAAAIHACLKLGLKAADLPEDAIQIVPTRDRAAVTELLGMTEHVDVIVPRGGKGLVGLVQREARVPVFAHLEGIVHVYVDAAADPAKAQDVVMNAKTRRTGICGAAECLLIHRAVADTLGRDLLQSLIAAGVEVRADETLRDLVPEAVAAEADDWGREYLDSIIAARLVEDVDDAIEHIRRYSSHHTECVLTEATEVAQRFFSRVDSAILMWNASTQFADGGEFGMGAEIGIATGKMHARGPVGVEQLTSFKYLVTGDGTVRG